MSSTEDLWTSKLPWLELLEQFHFMWNLYSYLLWILFNKLIKYFEECFHHSIQTAQIQIHKQCNFQITEQINRFLSV